MQTRLSRTSQIRFLGGRRRLLPALLAWTSVVAAQAPPDSQPLRLSLSQAVEMALKNNLQSLLAEERIQEAQAQRALGLSALLPNLGSAAYQMNLTANLAAMGFRPGLIPGMPVFVGPFNRFDARLQMMQSVFNLAALRHYQAARHGVTLAAHARRIAVQQVTLLTALSYLDLLQAEQAVQAAQANVRLAERLLELARSQRAAGIATGLDVARAETRLANQRVQLAQAETARDTARLNLLRVIGAPLERSVVLEDPLRFVPEPPLPPEEAVAKALAQRFELKAAEERLRIAETERKAAVAGWLPSVSFVGDYGSSGIKPKEVALPTRSVGLRLDLPLFDGGRTRAQVQAAASRARQAELEYHDLRAGIEKEVRQALENLATREQQVRAAQQVLALAEHELLLAEDRFKNGVADNIEVVNAQTALENARQTLISSLTLFHMARLNLAVAMGQAEDFRLP